MVNEIITQGQLTDSKRTMFMQNANMGLSEGPVALFCSTSAAIGRGAESCLLAHFAPTTQMKQ